VGSIFSIRIDDQLAKKIEKMAKAKKVSKSMLIKKGIELLLLQEEVFSQGTLREVSEALRQNGHMPVQVDWNQIEEELSQSAPQWDTLSEAMTASRKREWRE